MLVSEILAPQSVAISTFVVTLKWQSFQHYQPHEGYAVNEHQCSLIAVGDSVL